MIAPMRNRPVTNHERILFMSRPFRLMAGIPAALTSIQSLTMHIAPLSIRDGSFLIS
jgi:hypothetical protein